MVTKLFVASAAIVLLGTLSEVTAQYRRVGYNYGYGQQAYYQQPRPVYNGYGRYPQKPQQPQIQISDYDLPPGVSLKDAEWVCKSPKTNNMLIISAEDLPAGTENNGQPQHPNPNNPFLPKIPPINPQPTIPQPPPTYPTPSTPQPNTEAPNINGEGLIEIRSLE